MVQKGTDQVENKDAITVKIEQKEKEFLEESKQQEQSQEGVIFKASLIWIHILNPITLIFTWNTLFTQFIIYLSHVWTSQRICNLNNPHWAFEFSHFLLSLFEFHLFVLLSIELAADTFLLA